MPLTARPSLSARNCLLPTRPECERCRYDRVEFRTLVIDPPWDYEWLSLAGRASAPYAKMDHDGAACVAGSRLGRR